MKQLICGVLCVLAHSAHAQNTLPNNGNVGIGTLNPSAKLDVNGSMVVDSTLTVKDSLTVQSTLRIEDNGFVEGELEVTGDAHFHHNITVMGISYLNNDVSIDGSISISSMQASIGNSRLLGVDDAGNLVPLPAVLSSNQNQLAISGNATIDGLLNTNAVSTGNILPAPGDSLIKLGSNTIYYNANQNMLFANQNSTNPAAALGMGLGNQTYGKGQNSLAMGEYVRTFGNNTYAWGKRIHSPSGTENTFTIGTGNGSTFQDPLINNISNSFVVGFNNDKTLYVGPDAGNTKVAGSGIEYGVGIGTTYVPMNFNLAVQGSAMFEDLWVKPQADWPDYVFDSSYCLLEISDLEDFIQSNGHLPGIPTAESVEDKGISLTDLQPILIQKIEEMTLYIIELEKRLAELEANENNTDAK